MELHVTCYVAILVCDDSLRFSRKTCVAGKVPLQEQRQGLCLQRISNDPRCCANKDTNSAEKKSRRSRALKKWVSHQLLLLFLEMFASCRLSCRIVSLRHHRCLLQQILQQELESQLDFSCVVTMLCDNCTLNSVHTDTPQTRKCCCSYFAVFRVEGHTTYVIQQEEQENKLQCLTSRMGFLDTFCCSLFLHFEFL